MTTETTLEEVQQTLAEYERIAIGTGEWNGTDAPEFSDDGREWTSAWLPTEDYPHPALCRATVYRKGVEHPVVVIVRWDEAFPADDDWRALWGRKPLSLFGAFAIRAALRRAFRDVIGERREPDETLTLDAPRTAPTDRDWLAEVAAAKTAEEVVAIHTEAKKHRAVDVGLERAIRRRLREVSEPAPEVAVMPSPKLAQGGIVMPARPTASTTEQPERVVSIDRPRPVPTPPKVRLEETVRRPKGARRPQKQKPRGPRG